MTDLELTGEPRPLSGSTAGLPPKLAALIQARGEGVLCGYRIGVPGGERHQEIARHFANAGVDWLEMMGPHAQRLIVIGEAIDGSFLVVDPAPPELLLFHPAGPIKSAGADLDDLVATLLRGDLVRVNAEWNLERALHDDPSFIGVPLRYDTREGDAVDEMKRALQSNDETACDNAFEKLAGGMLTADMLVVMKRLLAETPNKEWQQVIDKIAKRNPLADDIVNARAKKKSVLKRLVDAGLKAGGECGETILRELRSVRGEENIAAAVEVASQQIKNVPELAPLVERLSTVPALEAYVWLAALREGRVHGNAMHNAGPQLDRNDLPPIERSWPVVAIVGLHPAFQWCSPHRMQALGHVKDDPLVGKVVETFLITAEATFGNGGQDLAAQVRMRNIPSTPDDVERWISIINTSAKKPKRYTQQHRDGVFALLSYATEHDAVMRYFASDYARSPYRALRAAERRGKHELSLNVLRALYMAASLIPVHLRKSAAELAQKWGDAQATKEMPHIQKAVEAEERRMERI
jgi:hypothetical protein